MDLILEIETTYIVSRRLETNNQ